MEHQRIFTQIGFKSKARKDGLVRLPQALYHGSQRNYLTIKISIFVLSMHGMMSLIGKIKL